MKKTLFFVVGFLFLFLGGHTAYANDGIQIFEKQGQEWRELDDLNIFNSNHQVSDKYLSPNEKGEYQFTIHNNNDFPVTHYLSFKEQNTGALKIRYRLKTNDHYVFGNSQNYQGMTDQVLDTVEIPANGKKMYDLEWWWDSDDDSRNFNEGSKESIIYKLTLKSVAEADDKPQESVAHNLVQQLLPHTGSIVSKAAYLGGGLLLFFLLILFWRRRRNADGQA